MSEYKHGNWYCKPTNEGEALEIIERAVASGAAHAERVGKNTGYPNVYKWDYFQCWGVFCGGTFCNRDRFFKDYAGVEYTIEQVREKFPLPSERQVNVRPHFEHEQKEVVSSDVNVSVGGKPAQWDDKGLPPVGVWVISSGGAKVFYVGLNSCGEHVFELENGGLTSYDVLSGFSPIRSEREQFIGDVHDGYDGGAHHSTVTDLAGRIYDALKSGDLKAPEVDK